MIVIFGKIEQPLLTYLKVFYSGKKPALNQTETLYCFLKPAFSTKLSFEGDLGNLRTFKKKGIVGKK